MMLSELNTDVVRSLGCFMLLSELNPNVVRSNGCFMRLSELNPDVDRWMETKVRVLSPAFIANCLFGVRQNVDGQQLSEARNMHSTFYEKLGCRAIESRDFYIAPQR
jgi:hypothetical protein